MMQLQSTSHWHTGPIRPPIIVIIAGDTPRLDTLVSRVDDLLHSLSKLLELLLVLIAITLECADMAVSLCNRLYGAYSGLKNDCTLGFNYLFGPFYWTPIRGLG